MAFPAFAQEAAEIATVSPPANLPNMGFKDEAGTTHTVEADKGKLTAVHFWATWCVPCVAELPEIDAAQAAYGAKGFKVIAISLDGENGMPKVKKFFADHHITHLSPYLDLGTSSFLSTKAAGLPATLLVDDKGHEIGRVEGAADWKSETTKRFIETHLPK